MSSAADLYAEFEAEGGPQPSGTSAAGLYAEFEAEESEKDQRVWNLIGAHMPDQSLEGLDREEAVLRLSELSGIEPKIVRERYDEILTNWQKSQFDPRAFREATPWIDLVLDHDPNLAEVAARDVREGNLALDVGLAGAGTAVDIAGSGVTGANIQTGLLAPPGSPPFLDTLLGFDVAGEVHRVADWIRSAMSPEGQAEREKPLLKGEPFRPSTWGLGDDVTARTLAIKGGEIYGSMLGVVAASIAGGPAAGVVVGGLTAGGAGAEQARGVVEQMARTPSSLEDGAPSLLEAESTVYRRFRAQGLTHEQAVEATARDAEQLAFMLSSAVGAAGGAATGKILSPATRTLATRGAAAQIAGRIGIGALEEGTQEALESIATGVGIEAGAGIDIDITAGLHEDFLLGALGGAPVGGIGGVGAVAQQRIQRRAEMAKALLDAAKKSHLAKASPQTFAEVAAAQTEAAGERTEALYLDAEPTLRLFQEAGVDPREFFSEEQLEEARLTGAKLEVPLAKLPDLVNTGLEARLAEHATTRADEDTAAQAQLAAQELEEQAQALAKEIDSVEPGEAESRLLALLESDLVKAFKKKDAKPNLALWRAFVRTQAAYMGVQPEALFAEIEVRVRRRVEAGASPLEAATPAVEAERAVEDATPAVEAERAQAAEAVADGPISETTEIEPKPAESLEVAPISSPRLITPQRPEGEPISYRVIEADDLIQSHDPHTFLPNPDYPPGVQEREYHRQVEEQTKVATAAQRIDPDLLLSDTPTAVDGPPIVTSGARAIVLGGNGRTMMLKRASEEQRAAYKEALIQRAARFGIDPATVASMRNPVLVRVLDGVPDTASTADLIAAVRRTNEGMTQALSPAARAVAEAKLLSADAIRDLAALLEGDVTLRDVMRTRPQDVVNILRREGIITRQNQSEWLSGKFLTDAAKDRIEGMFLGRIVGSGDRLAQTQKSILNKLERAAPFLLRVEGLAPEHGQIATVQKALDLLADAQRRGMPIETIAGQQDLFGASETTPDVLRMAQLLRDTGPVNLAARFRAWSEMAASTRQTSLFARTPTFEEVRQALLGETVVGRLEQGAVILYQPHTVSVPRGYLERRGNQILITLTEKADRSTFLHETGHAFLEIALDIAERADASDAAKNQAKAILGWLGIESRAELTTEHHERWARAFEAYLMEGNAPSQELESAFARFRNWLVRVYRAIRNLNVELDDEVRSIFDRLLATDEEMARIPPPQPLFNSPEEAGMTLEEYQRYLHEWGKINSLAQKRADRAQMKEHLRTLDKAWRDELRDLRRQAEEDYERLPERKAWNYLRGRVAGDVRLDFNQVVTVLGKERARRYLTARIGGANIDEVAVTLGYESGADMLRKVDALPSKEEWARSEAQKRIREKHPSMLEQRDRLRAEIAKDIHGDHTLRWHLIQHKALMRKAGIEGEAPPLAVIRRAAEIVAERRQVKRLDPHVALRAASSFGRRAYLAASKGDYALASALHRQQIVNEALHRHLRDFKDEMAQAETYLRRQAKKEQRGKVGKAAEGAFLPGFDALLAAVGLAERRADLAESLEAFDALVRLAEAEGNPIGDDASALRALIAEPKEWRNLTVQQARAVRDAVKRVRTITKQMVETALENERIAVDELIARIEEEASGRRPDLGPLYAARQQKSAVRKGIDKAIGLHGAMIDPFHALSALGETARRFFGDSFNAAKVKRAELAEKFAGAIERLWRELPQETLKRRFEVMTDFYDRLGFQEGVNLGGPVDRLTLLMIALNMGNPHNRQLVNSTIRGGEANILAYLNEKLTEAEWRWVQSVWDALDGMWPEIAAKEMRVNGVPPERVEAMPIETPYGTLRGGYFPAKVDPRIRRTSQGAVQEAVAAYRDPGYRSAATPKSHTRRRAPNASYVVDLNWSVVPGHVAQVVHDIAFDEWVRRSARIVEDPRMRTLLQRTLGESRARELSDWIKFVSNQQAVTVAQIGNDWAKLGLWGRGRLAVGALGWAAQVALQDLTNAPVAMFRGTKAGGISLRWGTLGYVAGLTGVANKLPIRRDVLKKSGYMRTRTATESEARRREFLVSMGANRSRIIRARDAVANTAFFFLEYMDRISSTQIWLARYWEEKAAGSSEAEAVRVADRAVQDNLPTMDKLEQAAVMRQPGAMGAMMAFFGYFSKLYNITVQGLGGRAVSAVTEAARAGTWTAGAQASLEIAKMAGRYAAIMVTAGPLAEFLAGRGCDLDEDFAECILRKSVAMPFNMVPLVGSIAAAKVESALGGSSRFYITARAPIQSFAWDMIQGLGDAVDEDADSEERAWAALELLLTGSGLPTRQPMRTLTYMQDLLVGDEQPDDVFEAASGLIYGQRATSTPLTTASDLLQGR